MKELIGRLDASLSDAKNRLMEAGMSFAKREEGRYSR